MNAIAMPGIFPAPTARRVRREEVVQPAFGRPDPYAQLMACWVDYMNIDDRDLGAGGMKLAGDDDGEVERSVYDEQLRADLRVGEAVNAMVESLTVQHQWAIYRSQGISTAWRFKNAHYEAVLMDARDDLERKLRKNIATRIYFS